MDLKSRGDRTIAHSFILILLLATIWRATAQSNTPLPTSADPEVRDGSRFDANRPLARELETSVASGFTLVAVGDCIISRPMAQYAEREPGFSAVVKVLREADATYGNLETTILDMRSFQGYPYPGPDDVTLVAEPAVARDLAKMGFDLVSRANNHAFDWGVEGMHETSRRLDEAGLVYAGVGENDGVARAPHYFESPRGRVALVSMASTFTPGSDALSPQGAAPGRPGVSALKLERITIVPPQQMARLAGIADSITGDTQNYSNNGVPPANLAGASAQKLTLFGNKFESGKTFGYRYQVDQLDLAEVLKSIRLGKEHSDFLIASIHSHEPDNLTSPDPTNDFLDRPAKFLQGLARAAIDAGADVFITTGIHHLGPIEVYKNRPIFYGLGDFFWSDIQEPVPAEVRAQYRDLLDQSFRNPQNATDADLNNLLDAQAFAGGAPFETVIAESRYDGGRLSELRLYPVDLGYGSKLTESGIPRLASREKGQAILKRVQEMSEPLGTKIEIQEVAATYVVGIIRPAVAP